MLKTAIPVLLYAFALACVHEEALLAMAGKGKRMHKLKKVLPPLAVLALGFIGYLKTALMTGAVRFAAIACQEQNSCCKLGRFHRMHVRHPSFQAEIVPLAYPPKISTPLKLNFEKVETTNKRKVREIRRIYGKYGKYGVYVYGNPMYGLGQP